MDLIPSELHRLFAGRTFLWGGDLNSAESMDGVPGFSGGNRRLREIWRQAGSHDLRARFFTDERRTFFAPKRGPYQLDHVFADAVTEARVLDWRVDTGPVTSTPTLSDHAPIWVELE
jgi:endonuclease/exonuclease/phosphatase family metal-dependent hydrolase